jgi:AraC-like DNA-binding protein
MPVVAQQFRTTDVDVAERGLRQVYRNFTFQEPGPFEAFHYSQQLIGDENVNLAITDFGGRMSGKAELDGSFAIVIVEAGRFGLWNVDQGADALRPGLARPGKVSSLLDHTKIVMANFTEAAVKETVRIYHGVDRVDLAYPNLSPIDPAKDRLWHETLNYVRNTVLTKDAITNESIRASALRTLSLVAVDVFGIRTTMPTPPGTGAGPATVRRAQAFIDSNADKAITVDDVAAAAHISVRGLHAAFRRHLGISPLEQLRRVRLDAARAELIAANSTRTTVKEIALRWGFAHLGRFSAIYFDNYNEYPSMTLRN